MKKIILAILLFLGICGPVRADSSAADFLLINPSARLAALGDAGVAYGELSAVFFNPANLGGSEPRQIGFGYAWWLENIQLNYLALSFSPSDDESFGLEYLRLDYGEIPRIDIQETEYGNYGAFDDRLGVTYCQRILGDVFSEDTAFLGGTFKFIQQKIDESLANGYALDLGIKYRGRIFGLFPVPAGFSVSNLGPQMKFYRQGYNLPLLLRLGMALPLGEKVNMPVEISYAFRGTNDKLNFHLGAEYRYDWRSYQFSGRVGYRTDVLTDLDWLAGFTLGVGLNCSGVGLDYAFVPYSILGNTSRITLRLKF